MRRTALISVAASATLLLGVLAAPVATASDADDLTARELAEQAKDNLLDAKSVHMELTDRSRGAVDSKTQPTSMKLSMDRDGNCAGTMRMGRGGGSVEIVTRGEQVWMKPDTAFWKAQVPGSQGDAVAQLFKNRYIHGSTRDAILKGMAETCSLTSFQRDVGTQAPDDRSLQKGEETTLDDTKVIPLRGKEDGKQATMYVTSDAPHRIVRATEKGDGTDLALSFKDYDRPVPSETPSADESVDVGRLQEELQSL
ncbi:hypothetical protein [Streptomyces sp. TRM68367]|uniref:hypothetical protein n=1 Tax=Streptomyces sp. TRM68367 TaxID=2758415 RepID=UPI00165AA720|nr:hypothetical protein [Streptomyces sp. TRM68367]MBC9730932.1 hypothetical protein [Streptomyces sp. TRM68367]